MATITAAGTGSGIDIESLITQLMTAEKAPLTKLETKKSAVQSKISLIGQFKSLVSTLQTAVAGLQNLGKLNGIKATVGNADALGVTATNAAGTGSHSVDVLQLARAQRMVSKAGTFASATDVVAADAEMASAKISFGFASGTAKEVTVAAGDDGQITLQDVADAINGSDAGVRATLIKDQAGSVRLALTGKDTGAGNAFSIGVSYQKADGTSFSPATAPSLSSLAFDAASPAGSALEIQENGSAQDARMKLDGVDIVRAGNTISDAVEGLTFTLKATTIPSGGTVSTPTTLTLESQSGDISTQLKAFVDAYNALASTIKSNTSYDATTKTAGPLQGDSTIRSLQGQLRSLMAGAFGDGSGSIRTLTDLGISFQKDGTLALDSAKLEKAVANDLDGVIEFLGAFDQTKSSVAPEASKDGFGYGFGKLLKDILADDGLLDSRLDGLNSSVKRLDDQHDRLEARLAKIEERYRAKFTAMDTVVSNLSSLQSYITQLQNSNSSSSS